MSEEKQESGEILRREFFKDTDSAIGEVNVPTYVCHYCSAEFDTLDAIKAHIEAEHAVEGLLATEEGLIRLTVNGETHELNIEPEWTLADVLREKLKLTGTKVACNEGTCGACTVLIDGRPILSCMTLAIECEGKQVETIEELAEGEQLHPIMEAFIEHHGVQCGFCTPGQIMSTKALLERNQNPTEEEVKEALSGNLCICGCQPKIIESVLAAAEKIREA